MAECDTQPGKIVAIRDDQVAVQTQARGGCGRCQSPGGCGRPMDERTTTTWLPNSGDYQVGDAVDLLVAVPELEHAAWRAYGIPLITLMAGAYAGQSAGDLFAVIGAGLGLLAGLAWVRWRSRRLSPHLWIQPRNQS